MFNITQSNDLMRIIKSEEEDYIFIFKWADGVLTVIRVLPVLDIQAFKLDKFTYQTVESITKQLVSQGYQQLAQLLVSTF